MNDTVSPPPPTASKTATRAWLTGQRNFIRDSGEEIHMRGMDWKLVVWKAVPGLGRDVGQVFEKQE